MKKLNLVYVALLLGVLFITSACDNDDEKSLPYITIDDEYSATDESVTVSLKPNEMTSSYKFGIIQGNDLTSFQDGSLENIVTIESAIPTTHTFSGLEAGTTYTVVAKAVSDRPTGVSKMSVNTAESPFTIELDEETVKREFDHVIFSPKLSDNSSYYKYVVGPNDMMDEFLAGTMNGIQTHTNLSESVEVKGLNELTQYSIYLQAYGPNDRKGGIFVYDFVTMPEFAAIEINIHDVTPGLFYFHTIPNERVGFYIVYAATVDWMKPYLEKGPDAIREYLQSRVADQGAYLLRAEYDLPWLAGNKTDDQWVLCVQMYDFENEPIGEPYVERFSTPEYDPTAPPATMKDVSIVEVTANSVIVNYELGPDTFTYCAEVTKITDGWESSRSFTLWYLAEWEYDFYFENEQIEFTGLDPRTVYVAWAYPFNINGVDEVHKYVETFFVTLDEGEVARYSKANPNRNSVVTMDGERFSAFVDGLRAPNADAGRPAAKF